jgi:hypothetical protein
MDQETGIIFGGDGLSNEAIAGKQDLQAPDCLMMTMTAAAAVKVTIA